ncbi:MAG: hypothetical protein Q8M66_00490, partial [Actinomycetota bacterium]|nr:hypothetical protein [Actinomycetota bacterium]
EEMSGGGSATRSTSSRAFSQRPIEALFSNSMQRSHEDRQTRRVSRPDDHSLDLSPALRNTPEPDDSLNPRESQQCAMYMTEPEWLPSRRPDAYAPESSARDEARWSEDTALRLKALDYLADSAAEAIRTLRGLLEDEDPAVAREARRLLRELDVRTPEE